MSKLVAFYRSARKAAVPVVGLVGQAVALGLLHGTALAVASLILWAAAAAGVYGVRNAGKADLGGIKLGVEGTVLTMAFANGAVLTVDKATGATSYSGAPLRAAAPATPPAPPTPPAA